FYYPFLYFSMNYSPPTQIYTLSLHDALPISTCRSPRAISSPLSAEGASTSSPPTRPTSRRPISRCSHRTFAITSHTSPSTAERTDRKSTRLNSSHVKISYAVFCLKKKKE